LARPIVLIPHLFRLADVFKFLERTIHPPLVYHLDPSALDRPAPPVNGTKQRTTSGRRELAVGGISSETTHNTKLLTSTRTQVPSFP
jgi:hypothetical protein